jgi:hypothetical protein
MPADANLPAPAAHFQALEHELDGILALINEDAWHFIGLHVHSTPTVDVTAEARRLRAAADRLHEIVHAATAAHLL